MGDCRRENARFSFTGEIFVEEMRDFPNNWGFLKGKWVIFGLNGGILKRKWVILGLNGRVLKRKRVIFV